MKGAAKGLFCGDLKLHLIDGSIADGRQGPQLTPSMDSVERIEATDIDFVLVVEKEVRS